MFSEMLVGRSWDFGFHFYVCNSSQKKIEGLLLYWPAIKRLMEVKNKVEHITSAGNHKNEDLSIFGAHHKTSTNPPHLTREH